MEKDIDTLFDNFQKELKENDKKVKKELKTKTQIEQVKEFADFIKKNNCKKFKGGKNGK